MLLFLKVKWFLFKEERKAKKLHPSFKPFLKAFKTSYRFRNPYSMSKRFLLERGEADVHVYGETPLNVYARIGQESGLSSQDFMIELGCGRGVGTFFLSHLTGCRSLGIDWMPAFIQRAQRIAETSPRLPVAFQCGSMQDSDLSQATVIYLYGTCLSDEFIATLIPKFPNNARVVTVSYPLSDYSTLYRATKQFSARFPWGETEIYINERLESSR